MKLRNINTIMHKELKIYFNSPLAYIFITVFLVISSWIFFQDFFIQNQADMRSFFALLPWIFLFLIPAISMRMWAEEKKLGTIEIIFTRPITEWEAVLGKFMAGFAFLIITILLSLTIPILMFIIGEPDWGTIVGGYFGAIMLGGCYLATGCFMSSLNSNQIIAFIFTALCLFILYSISEPLILESTPYHLNNFINYLGLSSHYHNILKGVIDTRDIAYYLSLIFLFLYLTVLKLKKRHKNA